MLEQRSIGFAVITFVGINLGSFGDILRQRFDVAAVMFVDRTDVQFFDISFTVGTGMLFEIMANRLPIYSIMK